MKLLCFFLLVLCFHLRRSAAQPSTVGYPCAANSTTAGYPCQTYVFYRAASPFLDLAAVGDLFSVSRTMISEPSNISSPSSPLLTDQSLLVPISCGCNYVQNLSDSISFANLTYRIQAGDVLWRVSTYSYGNLTTYQSAEAVNPSIVPTNLPIGQDVIFPIFCKCPNQTQLRKGLKWVISYVIQPSDTLSSISNKLGANKEDIVGLNGSSLQPSSTVFVPVSKLPQFKQPIVNASVASVKTGSHKGAVIGLSVGLGVCAILLVLISGFWVYRERSLRRREEGKYDAEIQKRSQKSMGGVDGKESWKDLEVNLLADVSDSLDKYRVFEIGELRAATDGFDDKCLIQGSVYRGRIDGQMFAIKKMKWNAYQELKILQMVNHGSLVKLEGFCIDPEDGSCYLVYEHIKNGSLYSWLHQNNKNNRTLNWKTRLRIALDVANGLQYIHEHTRPQVVHKDIKSSNILLDGNMRAKIANFGLARSGCNAVTMHIVGTQGYMAPEYMTDGVVSAKMDVFSFGVVLLELISGKEAINAEGKVLWAGAETVLDVEEEEKVKRVREWMDPVLLGEPGWCMESVMSVMGVAVGSVGKDPSKRPSMVDVVYALSKSDDLLYETSGDGGATQVVGR